MSLRTKTQLAKKIGVPVSYIKAKSAKGLLTIYKKCISKDMPFPPIGTKMIYKDKLYGIPRTRLGNKLYAKVFLDPTPQKNALVMAAKKMKIKDANKLTKSLIRQALTAKMIAIGFREPVLIMSLKGRKKFIKNNVVDFSPIKKIKYTKATNTGDKESLIKYITNQNNNNKIPKTIKINKTTTVIHKSTKKNTNQQKSMTKVSKPFNNNNRKPLNRGGNMGQMQVQRPSMINGGIRNQKDQDKKRILPARMKKNGDITKLSNTPQGPAAFTGNESQTAEYSGGEMGNLKNNINKLRSRLGKNSNVRMEKIEALRAKISEQKGVNK